MPGPLGQTQYPINAVAVSVTNTDLAVTTNARTTLRRAAMMPGDRQRLAHRSYRTVEAAVQQVWRDLGSRETRVAGNECGCSHADNTTHEITSPAQNITAFKISPDGTRMALVRRTANGSELGLARIIRSDQPKVEAWRRLDTSQSGTSISEIADVAWFDPTELLVLGKAGGNSTLFRVAQDASLVTQKGEAQDFDAVELAVSPQTQSAIMVGSRGGTWKDDGTSGSRSSITRSAPSRIPDDAIGTTCPRI